MEGNRLALPPFFTPKRKMQQPTTNILSSSHYVTHTQSDMLFPAGLVGPGHKWIEGPTIGNGVVWIGLLADCNNVKKRRTKERCRYSDQEKRIGTETRQRGKKKGPRTHYLDFSLPPTEQSRRENDTEDVRLLQSIIARVCDKNARYNIDIRQSIQHQQSATSAVPQQNLTARSSLKKAE